ncbi:MAG: AgmX/PglI C-terminal domain-containing protein [Archangium sp.]
MINTLVISLALAADPAPATTTSKDDAMTRVVKDAVTQQNDGPDVSKLPFTPDSIKQVVMHYQPRIQGCYEDHLANKKKAPEGLLKSTFIITPDGLVKKATINKKTSTLRDPGLHDCVIAVISTMTFPKPPDGKDHPIEFPFNLKAVH